MPPSEKAATAGKMTRRARQRAATLEEIRRVARRLLVERGSAAVSINAIAREMGLSGPALYRYYASQAELAAALRADFYRELIDRMRAAGEQCGGTPGRRLLAISRALRGWAVAHPAEFGWLFASPAPAMGEPRGASPDCETGQAFGLVFLEQMVDIWQTQRFPVPSLEDMDPSLAEQLRAYSQKIDGKLPPEAAYVFLSCWMRLYGLLCMEVLNQISFAFTDLEPVFEESLQELCRMVDVPYEAP